MLFDPKWTETKADPLTLESLIAWLEKQPEGKFYDYMGCDGTCLLGQYFRSLGFENIWVGGTVICADNYPEVILPESISELAVGRPRTFGAALDRARAALAVQS
jgi:hypothetical protein